MKHISDAIAEWAEEFFAKVDEREGQEMILRREVLRSQLRNVWGIDQIDGKPLDECSVYEMEDELRRLEEQERGESKCAWSQTT
ncbi:hypothetical protein BSNK01_12370 [Bacillaceae bacterium]